MLNIISCIIIGLCAGSIIGLFVVHMINHMKEMRELKIFFLRRIREDIDSVSNELKKHFEEKKETNNNVASNIMQECLQMATNLNKDLKEISKNV